MPGIDPTRLNCLTGDEDDLSDEEYRPLVALLESDCSLKNEVEVGASDSSMVEVLICAFLRLFPWAMAELGPRRGLTGVSSLVGRQLDRVWTILPDLLALCTRAGNHLLALTHAA